MSVQCCCCCRRYECGNYHTLLLTHASNLLSRSPLLYTHTSWQLFQSIRQQRVATIFSVLCSVCGLHSPAAHCWSTPWPVSPPCPALCAPCLAFRPHWPTWLWHLCIRPNVDQVHPIRLASVTTHPDPHMRLFSPQCRAVPKGVRSVCWGCPDRPVKRRDKEWINVKILIDLVTLGVINNKACMKYTL